MAKKKNNDKPIVSFIGNSKNGVTGSCVAIEYSKNDGTKSLVILDCGLCQDGATVEERYRTNKRMLEHISKEAIANCTAVILSHAHIDHIGNVAIFNEDNGFKGRIISSEKTIEISKKLLKDSMYIHQKDIEYIKSKGKYVKPLYTEEQMYQAISRMEYAPMEEKITIDNNLSIVLHHNSHVLGAVCISLYIRKPNNTVKHIVYTGDMGSSLNYTFCDYVHKSNIPTKCNIFISEATYNTPTRSFSKKDIENERTWLKKYVKDSILSGKRVLFCTFAYSRSQQILTDLYRWFGNEDWFKNTPIIMDGVLMDEINTTYLKILDEEDRNKFEHIMSAPNLKRVRDFKISSSILAKRTVGIYFASSGFCETGRITSYIPHFIPNSNDCVILTGYCGGEGSVGWQIARPEYTSIRTKDKKIYDKKADCHQLRTYTSHISYDELLKLWCGLNCDKILVHHSNTEKKHMVKDAKAYMLKKGVTTPIVAVSDKNYQFFI